MATSELRVVTADELRSRIRFEDLIEPVARAYRESSAGYAQNGLIVMFPGERTDLGDVYVKTGVLRGHKLYIVKISPWFAANASQGLPQGGFIGVFDSRSGRTLAILCDEHYLSDIRTAAAGALAARWLAPTAVRTAAVLGAGVQAYWQVLALYRERRFTSLLVWARRQEQAERLKARLHGTLSEVRIEVGESLADVVRHADVVITATSSRESLIQGSWLRPGQHITAVGADDPTKCELDSSALRRACVFVDSLEAASAAGCIHRAIQTGDYSLGEITGELGEVAAGTRVGRRSDRDITIAKLVGIGAQDLVAAETALYNLGLQAGIEV